MNRLIMLFLLFLPFAGLTQQVKIIGTAPGAERKKIEVITYGDLITFREKTIAFAPIDSLGNFTLTFDLYETIYATLSIDFHKVELFLQPARTYNIKIAPMDYNEMKEVNPFIQSANLAVEFQQYNPTELNSLIQAFNNLYNQFLLDNFNALYRDRNRSKLDTFRIKVVETFPDMNDPYFAGYVKYKMASLVQLCQAISQPQIGKTYFTDAPILYNNIEYMDFFNSYFSKYLTATSRALKFTDYKTILKGPDQYNRMMKALEADTILKKSQLRELVLLKGLMEMANSKDYNPDDALVTVAMVARDTKIPENRQIAENMINTLIKLKPGTPAPPFVLTNRELKKQKLTDYRGKPVYLFFWTTYCQGCVSELDLLKPIYDKYKDRVHFVSVSADQNFIKMLYFINLKKDFVWDFLNVGDTYEVLKNYEVKSYPLAVLIDGNGNIYKYPAELPDEGLETTLQKLVEQ